MYDIFLVPCKESDNYFTKKTRNTAKTSANRIYLSRQTSGHRIFVM